MWQDNGEWNLDAYKKHIEGLQKKARFVGILGIINLICAVICMFAGDFAGFVALMFFAILNLAGASLFATLALSGERFVKSFQDREERRKKVHDLNPHKW